MTRSRKCRKKNGEQHFLKNVKQEETPRREIHQCPGLKPKKIDQKIDARVPRNNWTIYNEQRMTPKESPHSQGQPNGMGPRDTSDPVERD